jgi:hypothetical protein
MADWTPMSEVGDLSLRDQHDEWVRAWKQLQANPVYHAARLASKDVQEGFQRRCEVSRGEDAAEARGALAAVREMRSLDSDVFDEHSKRLLNAINEEVRRALNGGGETEGSGQAGGIAQDAEAYIERFGNSRV